jgi:hypothetical protein
MATNNPTQPQRKGLSIDDLIRSNEHVLKGRSLILKFRKGGRIKEEHVYLSEDHDWESQFAISTIFQLACQGVKELGPHIIGCGVMGVAPWQNPVDVLKRFHEYDDKKNETMPADLKAARLDLSTPMRIADYVELPDGTIKIDVE